MRKKEIKEGDAGPGPKELPESLLAAVSRGVGNERGGVHVCQAGEAGD